MLHNQKSQSKLAHINLFDIAEGEKAVVFIDGNSLYQGARACNNGSIDFKKLTEALHARPSPEEDPYNYIVDIFYYGTISKPKPLGSQEAAEEVQLTTGKQKMHEWLAFHGYNVITRDVPIPSTQPDPRTYSYQNFAVDITIAAIGLLPHADHYIFFVNDLVYMSLFKYLRLQGKRVTLIAYSGTVKYGDQSQAPHIVYEMRHCVQRFIDIASIFDVLCKDRVAPSND